jgi:hypothetical protein
MPAFVVRWPQVRIIFTPDFAFLCRAFQRIEGVHPEEVGKQRVGIFGNVRMRGTRFNNIKYETPRQNRHTAVSHLHHHAYLSSMILGMNIVAKQAVDGRFRK